ncbi:MAG: clostripain-related cysteine peptidase [Capnocytophaga sp.]|nr:clostripain-related cysteine peptidase [Capnocytophaga sp.]
MKKILFLISFFLFVACQKEDPQEVLPNTYDITLVYMIADNDLAPYAIKDINEMERGFATNDKDKVLVYIDTNASAELPAHPILLEIVPDQTDQIKSKILYSYQEQNSANSVVLTNILKDAFSYYQGSKPKGLILWSHGNAWLPEHYHIATDSESKSFGKDFSPKNASMGITDLAEALRPFHFEYILFDACFMASIEVLYELRHATDFFIASPAEILADGFPYHQIMPYLLGRVQLEKVTQTYYDYYNQQSGLFQSATVTLVDANYLNELATFLQKNNTITKIQVSNLQQYSRKNENFLFDLKQILLHNETISFEIKKIWQKLCKVEKHTSDIAGMPLDNCNGISTFLFNQNKSLNEYYKTLSWHKQTQLASFYFYL